MAGSCNSSSGCPPFLPGPSSSHSPCSQAPAPAGCSGCRLWINQLLPCPFHLGSKSVVPRLNLITIHTTSFPHLISDELAAVSSSCLYLTNPSGKWKKPDENTEMPRSLVHSQSNVRWQRGNEVTHQSDHLFKKGPCLGLCGPQSPNCFPLCLYSIITATDHGHEVGAGLSTPTGREAASALRLQFAGLCDKLNGDLGQTTWDA